MELPELGTVFESKYRLDRILGEGGFARVYYAEDAGAGRFVALKILQPNNGEQYSEEVESRFQREVRIVANLRNPHTVTMFDFGRSKEGLLYVVFEFIPGVDLSELLKQRGRLSEQETVHITVQLLRSLREAHQAGLLHRDIKPQNIRIYAYMDDPLRVSVLDFGIARAARRASEHSAITHTGSLVGTPQYMSPEQLLDEDLTAASDLYSVGLVVYQMLVGEPAIAGNALSDQLRILGSIEGLSLPPNAPVSPPLRAIVNRLIARQVSDRYASAQAVIDDLTALSIRPHSGAFSGANSGAHRGANSGAHRGAISGGANSGAQLAPHPPTMTVDQLPAARPTPRPRPPQDDRLSNGWLIGALLAIVVIIVVLTNVVINFAR